MNLKIVVNLLYMYKLWGISLGRPQNSPLAALIFVVYKLDFDFEIKCLDLR